MQRSLMAVFSKFCIFRDSRHDRESEKITQLLILVGFSLKVSFNFSMAEFMAKASASKFEQWTPHGSEISSHSLSRYSILAPNPAFKVPLKAEPSVNIWWKSVYLVLVLLSID